MHFCPAVRYSYLVLLESPFDQFGAADIDGALDVQIVVFEETAAVDNQHL